MTFMIDNSEDKHVPEKQGELASLPEIEKGLMGWKVRKLERQILDSMSRSTIPNTGWHIYQKIRFKTSAGGNEICMRMHSLANRGYLKVVGSDGDCGYLYELPPPPTGEG